MSNYLKNWKQRQELADRHNVQLEQERRMIRGCMFVIVMAVILAGVLRLVGLAGIW